MMEFVVGIDGGGTKTTVCVSDLHGNLLAEFRTGAVNINGESAESVRRNLNQIFLETSQRFGGLEPCKSVCIGAAGASNEEARRLLEETAREAGLKGFLVITGDYRTALYGALGKQTGAILISGTGSICYGRNSEGKEHRAGGFGYLIDDEGSGYAIGRDILSAVVRAHDGRREKTLMTGMVFERLSVSSIEELVGFLYRKNLNKREIADLAPIMTQAYVDGDTAACEIAGKCSRELLELVRPVIEELGLQSCSLAMAGSILQKDAVVRNLFSIGLASKYPDIVCKLPINHAAYGAALIALDQLTGSPQYFID